MISGKRLKKWLLKHCMNKKGEIELSGLDLDEKDLKITDLKCGIIDIENVTCFSTYLKDAYIWYVFDIKNIDGLGIDISDSSFDSSLGIANVVCEKLKLCNVKEINND